MIILLVLAATVLFALARGGRVMNLASINIRWPALIFAGFFIQIVIFTPPWQEREALYEWTQLAHILSLVLLWAALAANWRLPGMPLIAAGFTLNLAVVLLNAGYMPVSPLAFEVAGRPPLGPGEISNNSIGVSEGTRLPFLGDIFAIPPPIPFANVFSAGDVLISAGAIYLVYKVMTTPVAVPG